MRARRWGACPSVSSLTHEAFRLGSTVARLKLKGIDGGPHKRWSMWFNSTQRAEPYQPLTSRSRTPETESFSSAGPETGAAWLSSARVVRCWVKSRNERNPHPMLPASSRALFANCPGNREEGGDDVKSAWPLRLGLHPCYNGRDKGMQDREVEPIPQTRSQFGLQAATRLHEVGIASNRRSAKRR